MRGSGRSCHKTRGISHKKRKEKCKFGDLTFYRFTDVQCHYPSAVAPVAACDARTRRFSQNSTVYIICVCVRACVRACVRVCWAMATRVRFDSNVLFLDDSHIVRFNQSSTVTERFTGRAKITCPQLELHVAPSDG